MSRKNNSKEINFSVNDEREDQKKVMNKRVSVFSKRNNIDNEIWKNTKETIFSTMSRR